MLNGSGGKLFIASAMVDSGNQVYMEPDLDPKAEYAAMVDASLARDAKAEILAFGNRTGNTVHFDVEVVNGSGVTLGLSNSATVWAIVYEEFDTPPTGQHTNYVVRAIASASISPDLANGASGTYMLDTSALSGVNWDNIRAIVLVDYQPSGNWDDPYDMLQAVSASID